MLGPNGGHGSERSAESSSGKGGSSDSSDHFESGICVKVCTKYQGCECMREDCGLRGYRGNKSKRQYNPQIGVRV